MPTVENKETLYLKSKVYAKGLLGSKERISIQLATPTTSDYPAALPLRYPIKIHSSS
jgi:hypothetical protein